MSIKNEVELVANVCHDVYGAMCEEMLKQCQVSYHHYRSCYDRDPNSNDTEAANYWFCAYSQMLFNFTVNTDFEYLNDRVRD